MSRDNLVDKFDECFGISTATEAQRKKFFDWVMAQQQAVQQNAHLTPLTVRGKVVCPECETLFAVELSKSAAQVA